jgi:hypothetical protein
VKINFTFQAKMKQIILILLIFTFVCACETPVREKKDPSLTSAQSIKIGAPSIEKEWTAEDYKSFNNHLDSLPSIAYPKITSSKSKALFKKLVSSINQPLLEDKKNPFNERILYCLKLQKNTTEILKKYGTALQNGNKYSNEVCYLMGLTIVNANQLIELADEFIPSLDSNSHDYIVRMKGVEQMKTGLATQFEGALVCITETNIYIDADRTILTEYLVEYGLSLISFLKPSSKEALKLKLQKVIKEEANKKIKIQLTKLLGQF